MADVKQDREALFKTIYKIATDLVHAGHVAEWDFKSYVLGTMFYRYISENFTAYINEGEHAAGNKDFDYAKMVDADAEPAREGLVQEKGFFILPSELFCNVLARADKDDNLNETLERVFNHIESSAASGDAENDFAGLFDDFDVNSKAIGETVAKRNKVLVELLNGVAQMPLFSTDGINPDLFGDAYEYLMGMYAANAGKKGGQYFTPADISELLARLGTIGKTKINKVYDPACGSGSLLLKKEKVLGKDNIERGFYGQEIDLTTYNLCRINMFLHNIEFDKFSIVREDTLLSPQHWDDQPFELIVSNPPFSVPWEGDKNPLLINDPRFSPAGVLAPASKGDMAFVMQSLIIPKFLYYALKNMEQNLNDMKRGAGVPHLSGEILLSIPLCVPSMEEQERIVSTLDRFDTLCTDLSSGLPAEIEARQKQYEYYRDKLLDFKQ